MFRNLFLPVVVLSGFIVSSTATVVHASTARLTLNREPSTRIFDIVYDTDRGDRVVPQIRRRLPDGSPTELLWILDRPSTLENEFSIVQFGTKSLGIPIQSGFYPEARRADFAPPGFAGLDVSFQNRGSNLVFGSFTINEVTFTPNRLEILTFDAEFLQRSETPTNPALRGRFRFNKEATSVPEPSSNLGFISFVCLLMYNQIKRTRKVTMISKQR
jgi:hypothetical protein